MKIVVASQWSKGIGVAGWEARGFACIIKGTVATAAATGEVLMVLQETESGSVLVVNMTDA